MYEKMVVFVVVAMLGLAMPAAAGATRPPGLQCGQVVTTSVTLRSDLHCHGDGLSIAASDITVSLAGHTISSTDGTGFGITFALPDAEHGYPCVDDVTVRGGTITGFAEAIDGECNSRVPTGDRVSNMRLIDNTWGFYGFQYGLDFDRTTIVGPNGIGPYNPGAPGGIHLSHSKIRATGVNVAEYSVGGSIDSSRLDGGSVSISVAGGYGLTISDSVLVGIDLSCWDTGITMTDSRVVGGTGLWGQACGGALHGDRFDGPGSGTAVSNYGYPWTVTDSRFTGWDVGLEVGGSTYTITGNLFRHDGTGVSCVPRGCVAGTVGTVSGNHFIDNTGTGLLLTTGTWHVGSNVALRNGGLGIDAEGSDLTVIDDGGNVARRNQAPQCIGVVCSPAP